MFLLKLTVKQFNEVKLKIQEDTAHYQRKGIR